MVMSYGVWNMEYGWRGLGETDSTSSSLRCLGLRVLSRCRVCRLADH